MGDGAAAESVWPVLRRNLAETIFSRPFPFRAQQKSQFEFYSRLRALMRKVLCISLPTAGPTPYIKGARNHRYVVKKGPIMREI